MTTELLALSNTDAGPIRVTERSRRFYLIAIWMPLLVPILCALSFAIRGKGSYAGVGDSIGMMLTASIYSTGVPYVVFALWVSHWLREPTRTQRQVLHVMRAAPLIVAMIAVPWWTITMGIADGVEEAFLESIVFYLPFLLAFGYLYVISTAIAHWVYARRHARSDGLTPTSSNANSDGSV
jgi:hypothetical protein